MTTTLLVQQVLNGLLDGVYYLLIALGLSLIFSLGGIVNLAHGGFFAIGAYLTVTLADYLGFGGAFVAAPVTVALLGVLIERFLFRRFYRADPILSLLLTFGLAMVAEQTLRWIYGAAPLSFAIPQVLARPGLDRRLQLFLLPHASCWVSPSCAWRGCGCCSTAPRSGAWCGPACRTPTWSARSASRSSRTWPRVAALGIGLAGLAGVLLAPIYAVHPAMGQEIITPAFVVVVIGGLGSFWGVVVAALLVGLVKGLIIAFGYTAFSTAAIYLLMMLILLFRPRGLFGERIQRFE